MGNSVYSDGKTMISGYSNTGDYVGYHSGYTGILYEDETYTSYTGIAYPENKYLDKYNFDSLLSKLGDGIKEVQAVTSSWYSDYNYFIGPTLSWFDRGGYYRTGYSAGVFYSDCSNGGAGSLYASRLVITP